MIELNGSLSKQRGHTEGVLTVRVKAGCSFKVVSGACGIFPLNFNTEWLLRHVHVHFDWAGSQKARHLAQTSCQETSYRELVQRSCQQSSYRNLVQGSCQKTSCGDLVQKSCQDASFGYLVQRHCIEICCRDLAKRSLTEILPRELL